MDYSHLTKEQVIEGIENNSLNLWDITLLNCQDERDVILEMAKMDGRILKCVSDRLKNDKEIVLIAVKKNAWVLQYASSNLKDDKELILEAVKKNEFSLRHASDRLQNDKELLEILEQEVKLKRLPIYVIDWYEERMDVLANIREKEIMENSIISNDKTSKKIKF